MKITLTGIHKETGNTIGPFTYNPVLSGGRRRAHEKACYLRGEGFFVVIVDPYRIDEADSALTCGFEIERGKGINDPVRFPYKVHSINTVNQQRQGSHIGFVATMDEAMRRAGDCVKSWNPEHKGVVIFKAIKLVRMRPAMSPLEIIDL